MVNTEHWLRHAEQAAAAQLAAKLERENRTHVGDNASVASAFRAGLSPWTMGERRQRRAFGQPQLLYNHSAAIRAALTSCDSRSGRLVPLSTTAHLIPIKWDGGVSSGGDPGPIERCYLGVGHLHRDSNPEVVESEHGVGSSRATRGGSRERFRFGGRYTHFWYTLRGSPPFDLLATSAEWCLAASQDPMECESIQFVSGIVEVAQQQWRGTSHATRGGLRRHGRRLSSSEREAAGTDALPRRHIVLSYGVSDCEAMLTMLELKQVWQMLRPMPGVAEICQT